MTVETVLQLPFRQRLQIMQAIWEDMRSVAERDVIPEEMQQLLDARVSRVETGKARLLDWEDAKQSIGRA